MILDGLQNIVAVNIGYDIDGERACLEKLFGFFENRGGVSNGRTSDHLMFLHPPETGIFRACGGATGFRGLFGVGNGLHRRTGTGFESL